MTTKSRAIERTQAELDSHRETMNIHREAALAAKLRGDWNSALIALKMALPHANVTHDKQQRSEIFALMNTARHNLRKSAAADKSAVAQLLSLTDA